MPHAARRLLRNAARLLLWSATLSPFPLCAQTPDFHSTELHADRSITFRYKDAAAAKVTLLLDSNAAPFSMQKDAAGVWSVTTGPLKPEIYSYHFEADGSTRLDPGNPRTTINLLNIANQIEVPGETPQPWEITSVPHGTLHRHSYTTAAVLGLPQNQSRYIVYTPPGYDAASAKKYPVLYLLHGYSDNDAGWTEVGQANLIFDNLLAQGAIKPMVVVMPLGYGDMAFLHGHEVWNDAAIVEHNTSLFAQALLTEVLPRVEAEYHVSRDREDRAIAGLSMGGLESLETGLTHTGQFAWIGGFSSAVHNLDYAGKLASLNPKAADLRLLWIACGTEDHLVDPNRKLVAFLQSKQMPVTQIETPGRHTWLVWRDNLVHFAPLLFQPK
ncbi:MAG: alpha/beta hydrolase-fold protein [Acidobacteriota bacterium]|nr:alpha/beta hydrolase-fold protein [Acidobacteriota bacterium]